MSNKFLYQMKPFLNWIPQVEPPEKRIALQEKLIWTLGVLLLFLVMSQIPLYGISQSSENSADPLYWFRPMLASNRGTLLELGISPIVTSGLIMQLLAGTKIIQVDYNSDDEKALFQTIQKFFAIIITIGEAVAYIFSGMYGDLKILGFNNVLIVFELIISGIIVIMLDEILQRGYGVGNSGGTSLFIATNICENIIWKSLAPISINTESGVQYEGALIALFHLLIIRKKKINGLKEAFYRTELPNITNLIGTIIVFIVVIYFQGFRIDLPVKNQKLRGTHSQTKYPIKLFYTSNIPIILQTALVSNIFFLSQVLVNRFGNNNIFTNILGRWYVTPHGISTPIGGLVYYLSPPKTFLQILFDPIHSIIYVIFILLSCALFSLTWIQVSGSSPKDVAKQLKDQGLVIRGYRENATVQVLDRYIPIAAALGGISIGALTIFADFLGAIGTGTGILLAVTIIFEIYENYIRDAQQEGLFTMPGMGGMGGMGQK